MLALSPPNATLVAPRPGSAADLCRAMLAAGSAGRSPDASSLDRTLRHDAQRGLLEVQAGATWRSLGQHVGGEFLPGMVGESVAANCAGPDGRPMVAHLRALTLVTAGGELRRASREHAPELFRLAVGGLGAFGPFYSLTLDLASLSKSAALGSAPVRIEAPEEAAVGPRHAVELLIPPERGDTVIGQVRAALEERRSRLGLLEARRVLAEDETFLCWARREFLALRVEYFARPTLGACTAAVQLRERLLDLAIGAGGSFMPWVLPLATRAQAAAGYPMLPGFLAEQRRLDPAEGVLTPWFLGVRRMWRAEACAVRWSKN